MKHQRGANKMRCGIINGVQWFDDNLNIVNAHGVGIIRENDKYYLFGEYKRDDKNSFKGFSCYSTEDFSTWHFEGMALDENAGDRLNGERIGERVKVVKSVATGKFIMLMHTDSLKYDDPCVCYAVSDKVQGPYSFVGPLLYKGEIIRRWDIGSFTDRDGTSYLLTHEGYIYKLSKECTEAEELIISEAAPGGESPAMCYAHGTYYWMFSNKTSWERNDNYYLTSKSLYGPWSYGGLFCKEGSRTYNTQCSFVLDYVSEGAEKFMYIGDRWSFPRQAAAATLVFLPLEFKDGGMSIPEYYEMWDLSEKLPNPDIEPFNFDACTKNESTSFDFEGEQVLLYGDLSSDGGYSKVEIYDSFGEMIRSDIIDFYSAVNMSGIRYASPRLKRSKYNVKITVLGEAGEWFKKDGTRFGSSGCRVHFTGISRI